MSADARDLVWESKLIALRAASTERAMIIVVKCMIARTLGLRSQAIISGWIDLMELQ